MYLLRISQKVLFICNLCWVAGLFFRYVPSDPWPSVLLKSILVMGWVVAFPFGIAWHVLAAMLFLSRKLCLRELPQWLWVANLLFIPAILAYRLW